MPSGAQSELESVDAKSRMSIPGSDSWGDRQLRKTLEYAQRREEFEEKVSRGQSFRRGGKG